MALRVQRGRSQCYDNPSVGNACSTFECTTVGNVPPVELVKWQDNLSVGNAQPAGTANIPTDIQAGVVTLKIENTKVGG